MKCVACGPAMLRAAASLKSTLIAAWNYHWKSQANDQSELFNGLRRVDSQTPATANEEPATTTSDRPLHSF